MRDSGAIILALVAAATLVGCGSGGGDGSSGPSPEQVVEANVKSAARNALLKHVLERKVEADQRLEQARAAESGPAADPNSATVATAGGPTTPETPKPPSAAVSAAQIEVQRWEFIVSNLRPSGNPDRVYTVKENKIRAAGADGMTSRLVLTPVAEFRDLLGAELTFDLEWVKHTRTSRDPVAKKNVIRVNWQMRDSMLVRAAGGSDKKAPKE